jgi:hypothetical protein
MYLRITRDDIRPAAITRLIRSMRGAYFCVNLTRNNFWAAQQI